MKKILFILVSLLLFTNNAFAVGSCSEALAVPSTKMGDTYQQSGVKHLVITCVGDVSTGTFPAYVITNMAELTGMVLTNGSFLNGTPGPTANSTVTLSTSDRGDILGGAGKGPTAATAGLQSKFKPIVDTTYLVSGPVPISGNMTLQISGSVVASGVAVIVLSFMDSK